MDITRVEDEHLEGLWLLEEKGLASRSALAERVGSQFSGSIMDALEEKGLLKGIKLTERGRDYTRRLIRAHRLAERLLSDVLGLREYEVGACEFEHIMNREILDGLCTLLGHPSSCPHGLPIPPGDCCINKEERVSQAVHSLSSLNPGESLKILYIQTQNDRELHILEGMRIRPGKMVKIHQTKPAFVIEVEGTHIALDESIGDKILGLTGDNGGAPQQGRPSRTRGRHHGRRRGARRGRGFHRFAHKPSAGLDIK